MASSNAAAIKEHIDTIKTEANKVTVDEMDATQKTVLFAGLGLLEILLCNIDALADAADR